MILPLITSILMTFCIISGAVERPNILWLSSEDNGPHIGSYGDHLATTPNLDALASQGTIYKNVWSTLPVCAPARTTIITGMYPSSIGAEHMRSIVPLPEHIKLFPQYLREAGYYCTNNSKEDYNVPKGPDVWDESSKSAHWKNRAKGQPFFAVFNFTTTHESQIRKRPHLAVHDPSTMKIPAYHPDTPEVRQDWAQYYDKITEMDAQVGQALEELKEAELADNTIIMYWGDHGSGMPRSKRSPTNSGLHVPLIVYIPDNFKRMKPKDYGTNKQSERLVAFIDFAPTLLALAGIEIPEHMQGLPFLGKKKLPKKKYLYGIRGRMDERFDLVRSLRDERYVYIKNYMPHRPHGQFLTYQMQTPTTQVWFDLYNQGKLNIQQAYFWGPKDSEELYDLEKDPDEVNNLVNSAIHQKILKRMSADLINLQNQSKDVGLVPEADMLTLHATDRTPYEVAHDNATFNITRVNAIAHRSTGTTFDESLIPFLSDADPTIRYWLITGLLIHHASIAELPMDDIRNLLNDPSPSVRIVAAELLIKTGNDDDINNALALLAKLSNPQKQHPITAAFALNAVDYVGEAAYPIYEKLKKFPNKQTKSTRTQKYAPRMLELILADKQ